MNIDQKQQAALDAAAALEKALNELGVIQDTLVIHKSLQHLEIDKPAQFFHQVHLVFAP